MSPEEERKRKEKKMPFIVATYVYASIQGQRTHSAKIDTEKWENETAQNYYLTYCIKFYLV
jgi:hypothetical protein